MDDRTLEEEARKGITEAVSWHIMAIDVSVAAKNPEIGTGTLVQVEDRLFILTCKHIVKEDYDDKDLQFFYRGTKTIQHGTKEDILQTPLHELDKNMDKAFPEKLIISNRFYSNDVEDLVLLELKMTPEEAKRYHFFRLSDEKMKEARSDAYSGHSSPPIPASCPQQFR